MTLGDSWSEIAPLVRELSERSDASGFVSGGFVRFLEVDAVSELRRQSPDFLGSFVSDVIRVSTYDEGLSVGRWLVDDLLDELEVTLPIDAVEIVSGAGGYRTDHVGFVISRGDLPNTQRQLEEAIAASASAERSGQLSRLLDLTDRYAGAVGLSAAEPGHRHDVELVLPFLARREPNRAPARAVNTGFCAPTAPLRSLSTDETLEVGRDYCFWFEIGGPLEGGIDEAVTEIPTWTPANADLEVVIFPDDRGVDVRSGAVGAIGLRGESAPEITRASFTPEGGRASRLYFLLRVDATGEHTLRCNLYYQQVLVQSRIVRLHAAQRVERRPEALKTVLDFSLSSSLDQEWIDSREPHVLSLMINGNGDGTHRFMFVGHDGKTKHVSSSVITEGTITDLISEIRGALRIATYGVEEPYRSELDEKFKYRKPDDAALEQDLVRLARRGYRMYMSIARFLAPPTRDRDARAARAELERVTREPGFVQVATKIAPSLYLPAALIYDHPLKDEATTVGLCDAFQDALTGGRHLVDTDCFRGHCPNHGDKLVVCPSGFWGYRHAIGMPDSESPTDESGDDMATAVTSQGATDIRFTGKPTFISANATDLTGFRDHHDQLVASGQFDDQGTYDDRDELFRRLQVVSPHLLYFYCHGGHSDSPSVPFLRIGDENAPLITPTSVQRELYWPTTRPLVFINGCRSTELEPSEAHNFVSAFVIEPRASGVIGTEVAISEELAQQFATSFFEHVIAVDSGGRSESIGEAVRQARLRLLGAGNPLGLVYIPFIPADVRLIDSDKVQPPAPVG